MATQWLVVDSSTSRSTTAFTIEPSPALDSASRHLKPVTFTSNLLSVVSDISYLQVMCNYMQQQFSVPAEVLEVTATSDDSSPILGQSYSMDCVGHKTISGLMNLPSPQWLTPTGHLLSSNNDTQLRGPSSVGLSSSELVARFPTLCTSHAGSYTCRASLSSSALMSPIVKTETFAIIVQSKSAILPLYSSISWR